jgi:hypothetical protein
MRVERWLVECAVWCVAGWTVGGVARGQTRTLAGACSRAVIEGEVSAGQGFEWRLGNGLEVWLQPIASGWIVRVIPATGPRVTHDYAELATPPYQSVSPLSVSTDFSFRAQDAVAWNPRHFRFAADASEFARLSAAYEALRKTPTPTGTASTELAVIVARAPEGELQIVDAKLVPGTANQAGTAAMVASHFAETPHTIEQPTDGKPSPLGRVTWMRFRLRMDLPAGFRPERGLKVEPHPCRMVR